MRKLSNYQVIDVNFHILYYTFCSCVLSFDCMCVCDVCAHNRHINKCLLFITWNLAVNVFCFGFLSLLLCVLYAPSRFLFVHVKCAWISQRLGISKLLARSYIHTHIRTHTYGSISRYIKWYVRNVFCVHTTHLNEAINLFCCVMVDGNNQVYDKEYVCTIHVHCTPIYKPIQCLSSILTDLNENNDMSL